MEHFSPPLAPLYTPPHTRKLREEADTRVRLFPQFSSLSGTGDPARVLEVVLLLLTLRCWWRCFTLQGRAVPFQGNKIKFDNDDE